jgi:hypothetical protein
VGRHHSHTASPRGRPDRRGRCAVDSVPSWRRSAPSGAGPRLCLRARPKSSCAWAQRAGYAHTPVPRALSGSTAMIGRSSDRPHAPIGQP